MLILYWFLIKLDVFFNFFFNNKNIEIFYLNYKNFESVFDQYFQSQLLKYYFSFNFTASSKSYLSSISIDLIEELITNGIEFAALKFLFFFKSLIGKIYKYPLQTNKFFIMHFFFISD